MPIDNTFFQLDQREKAANKKCFKCSHIFLASWILECGELKSNSRFVCFIYYTGLTLEHANANSLIASYLLRKAVRLW